MNNLIPKSLNKQKLILYKNFSLVDLVLLFVYLVISALLGYGFSSFGLLPAIVSSIAIMMVLTLTLFESKTYHMKNYSVVICWFRFLSKNKNYKSGKKSIDTKMMMPYQSVYNDNLLRTKFLSGNIRWYVGAVEVQGFNISALSFEEQELKISSLANFYRMQECEISLVKVNEPIDFEKIRKNLNQVSAKLKSQLRDKVLIKEQYNSREKQINRYKTDFYKTDSENFNKKFYMFFYHKNPNELQSILKLASSKLMDIGFNSNVINSFQIVNLIKSIWNPFEKEFTYSEFNKYQNHIDELLKFDNIQIKSNYLKINNMYYSIFGIYDYPVFPKSGWGANLSDNFGTMIWNISQVDQYTIKKTLHKAIINAQTNLISLRKIVDQGEQGYQINAFQNLVESLVSGEEKIKKMNLLYLNSAVSLKELKIREREIELLLKENNYLVHKLQFRQYDAFSSLIPKPTDPLIRFLGREVPCQTLGASFPFLNNNLKDEKGIFLGMNSTGDVVNFDQFLQTGKRQNHNMVIMGMAGSGKSNTGKKLLNWHISNGRKVIVIDPEREYKYLSQYHNGDWIDVGNATSGRINPFQIMGTLDENDDNTILLSNHLQLLEHWFSILMPDLNAEELRYLIIQVNCLYALKMPLKKKYTDYISSDFPTFDDFKNLLENTEKIEKENRRIHKKILSIVKFEFTGTGKYAQLYNGHSTITLNKNLLNVFDIYSLFEKGDQKIIQAQLFLILAYIQNEVKINRFATDNEIVILVDEAHLIIDKDNPIGLNFMFQMVKRIRKYRGSMILITQNPDDFVGSEEIKKKTMAMLNNTQYMFVMNLSPQNLIDIQDMFRAYGGLSAYEIDFIAKANRGEGLFIVSGHNRHCIKVELSKSELEAFNGKI